MSKDAQRTYHRLVAVAHLLHGGTIQLSKWPSSFVVVVVPTKVPSSRGLSSASPVSTGCWPTSCWLVRTLRLDVSLLTTTITDDLWLPTLTFDMSCQTTIVTNDLTP